MSFVTLVFALLGAVACLAQPSAPAKSSEPEEIKIYTEHPRLLLPARRLKLLRRERDRDSIRWQQFRTLMVGGARMPEPGFAGGLYYQATNDEKFGREALKWALTPANTDVRQLALVYDWSAALMSEAESKALAARLKPAMAANPANFVAARNIVFAAVALHEVDPAASEAAIGKVITTWWRGKMVAELKSGQLEPSRDDLYALMELFHAVRDNTNIDLRDDAPRYFADLPAFLLLGYYPASFPAPENEYRIPYYSGNGEPDIKLAMFSRAAELSIVAYDTNAQETQFLQGWLTHDRFLLRSALGIVYEFLWANPYQPGLSYYHLPLHVHDRRTGTLFLRSSWEDDAVWFRYSRNGIQMFEDGARKDMTGSSNKPVQIGGVDILFPRADGMYRFKIEAPTTSYIVKLKPGKAYNIEVDDEEMDEVQADPGGIVALHLRKSPDLGVKLTEFTEQK